MLYFLAIHLNKTINDVLRGCTAGYRFKEHGNHNGKFVRFHRACWKSFDDSSYSNKEGSIKDITTNDINEDFD